MVKENVKATWDGQQTDQPRNIYQELHRTLAVMEHPHTGRSQDDVPSERILLYVIKDYQRMLEENIKLKQKIEDKKRKWENNDVLKKERNKLSNEVARLQNNLAERDKQIAELRQGREAVVKAMTDDLQQELDTAHQHLREARQQIVTLAGIISSGGDAGQLGGLDLSRVLHPADDPEEREWLGKSLDHLNNAFLRLSEIEDRLNMYLIVVRGAVERYEEFSSFKNSVKKLGKASDKIESCCAHIEQFFEVVGDIKIDRSPSDGNPNKTWPFG